MKQTFKEYLTLNKRERNALMIILVLLVIVISIRVIQVFSTPKLSTAEIQLLEKGSVTLNKNESSEPRYSQKEKVKRISSTKPFDPNLLSIKEWESYGLSKKQAMSIQNYKNAGGKFQYKEDIQKIYVLSEELTKQLLPLITLPSNTTKTENKPIETTTIEINTADSAMFTKLRGIGPAYANRIIKYRNLLGGFISIEQLNEVYGIEAELVNELRPNLTLEPTKVSKLNINKMDAKALAKHPYLNYKLSNAIVKYRKANGNYQHIEDIKQIYTLNDSIFERIKAYITIND